MWGWEVQVQGAGRFTLWWVLSSWFIDGCSCSNLTCKRGEGDLWGNFYKGIHLLWPSVQFSHSVVSDSLRPHELLHTRPSCPSPTPEVYLNSCLLSWWCHPAISSSVVPFSSCIPPESFPASGSFPMSLRMRWPKSWSFSFSISPSNEYSGLISFRLDWLDLLAVQGTLKSLLQHHSSKASILQCLAFFIVQFSIHIWLLEKP